MFYSLLSKFDMRHEGLSFYCFRKSDKGGDTDLMYDFCLPYDSIFFTVFEIAQA